MTAFGGSVEDLLRGNGSAPAWGIFDPTWYLATYAPIQEASSNSDPESVLRCYIQEGQKFGHSPNMYFDEGWHRTRYPRVTQALKDGDVISAFDTYCRLGFNGRSPHWLFDELLYRSRYPDITEDYLASRDLANGYDHYLRYGQFSGRSGHLLFDPVAYGLELNAEERRNAEKEGYFTYYLKSLGSRAPERRTSILFDPSWHLASLQREGISLEQGGWLCGLHHYLCNATPERFDPLPEFSEKYYLGRYKDVARAVRDGRYRNGYEHFLMAGKEMLRAPHRSIDLAWYASKQEVVRDLARGKPARDAFEHYLVSGRLRGMAAAPSQDQFIDEESAQLLFRRKASGLLPMLGRHRLDFSCRSKAQLSVVLVLYNQFELTMRALASLRENFSDDMELVLVDSGSTDETRFIGQYVTGARLVRFEDNVGYLRGWNAGLHFAGAELVLAMNNDVELAPGAVQAAVQRLKSQPRAGAVGGKIVRCHGLLQEAGCIIWCDGSAAGYLRDSSPLTPEVNFVRRVDYCSAVFLLLRGDLLRSLGGIR